MAVFEYKGYDGKGGNVAGIVDAESGKAARQKLRKQGVFPIDVHEGKAGSALRKVVAGETAQKTQSWNVQVDFSRYLESVSVGDLAIATRQLAALLGAGIPLVECLQALSEQVEKERFRIVLREIREKVNEGSNLADAFKAYPAIFGDIYVNMVRAGEQAGALELVLARLADYTEAQVELRGKVISAMTYPGVMMMVAIGVISFLITFVVPKITKIFKDMGGDLPWITRFVVGVSEAAQSWWWLVILLAIGGIYAFRQWYVTPPGRQRVDGWVLAVPVFGRMILMVHVARFASTLSTLLSSGVPLLSAMGIVKNIVANVVLSNVVQDAHDAVREGHSMSAPLKKSGRFPPMVVHMIAVGERTGELGNMLNRVAATYESQVNRRLSTLTSLLEPLMILVMGGVVFFIALAVLLPMLQMNTLAR